MLNLQFNSRLLLLSLLVCLVLFCLVFSSRVFASFPTLQLLLGIQLGRSFILTVVGVLVQVTRMVG